MTTQDVIQFIITTFLAALVFTLGILHGRDHTRKEAIATHNAHWEVNETTGKSSFTWNK